MYRGRKPSIDPAEIHRLRTEESSVRPRLRVGSGLGGPRCIARSPAVMVASRKVIPVDSLVQLRQRLDRLPPKSPERAAQIAAVAQLYGVLDHGVPGAPGVSQTVQRIGRIGDTPRAAQRGPGTLL